MAGLAHTTPRARTTPRLANLRAHLGAYLVGVGATSALTAGAVVVFLSLAAFVAFNGLPTVAGSSSDAGAAYLSSNGGTPPAAAAAALGEARDAAAKGPITGAHRGGASFAGRPGDRGLAAAKAAGGSGSDRGGSAGPGGSPGPGGSAGPGGPGAIPPSGPGPGIPSVPNPPSTPSVPNPPGGVNPPPVNVPATARRRQPAPGERPEHPQTARRRQPASGERPELPSRPALPNAPSLPSAPSLPNLPSLP